VRSDSTPTLYKQASVQSVQQSAPKPDLSRKTSKASSKQSVHESPDVLNLTAVFTYEGYDEFPLAFAIHKTRGGDDVWRQVTKWMQEEFNYEESPERKLRIIFNNKEIPNSSTSLSELGLANNSRLDVKIVESTEASAIAEVSKAANAPEMAPKDKIPKAPKAGI